MDIIKNYITIPFAKFSFKILNIIASHFLPKNILIYYHAYARLRLKENCQLGS